MGDALIVGQTIRGLRRKRRLTGDELARKSGVSQSRISKIETGATTNIKAKDIQALLNILDAPQTIRQQIMQRYETVNAAALQKITRQHYHTQALELESGARYIRIYVTNLIPALLQTSEYHRSILKSRNMLPSEFQLAMQAILTRQDMLWEKHRHYHFILSEVALYTLVSDKRTQLTQLDRLERLVGLNGMMIGIIPLQAGLSSAENGNFVVYDNHHLSRLVADEDMVAIGATEIAMHLKIFAALDRLADYGDNARALVRKAMDYFS